MIDLRTDLQKRRAARRERVVGLYRELRPKAVGSQSALCAYIAERVSDMPAGRISEAGVRAILVSEGLIEKGAPQQPEGKEADDV